MKLTLVCAHEGCGRVFSAYPSKKRTYCSRVCAHTAQRGKTKIRRNPTQRSVGAPRWKVEMLKNMSHAELVDYCDRILEAHSGRPVKEYAAA